MKIEGILNRNWKYEKCTIGTFQLFLWREAESENDFVLCDLLFTCGVCEDAVRGDGDPATVQQWKIKGETAIPYGAYKVRKTYSNRFQKEMWELQNVPGFAGIRIHAGNTHKDTEGCLLFGEYAGTSVVNSRATIEKFEKVLSDLGNPEWGIIIQ
ncbi:MAG: DUF5675 family protein [Fibromonadaceae bacterium]|jgi:hypothetical protein|nr:DUF5675 family protein [Fibromonadaceae bacterium]